MPLGLMNTPDVEEGLLVRQMLPLPLTPAPLLFSSYVRKDEASPCQLYLVMHNVAISSWNAVPKQQRACHIKILSIVSVGTVGSNPEEFLLLLRFPSPSP
mmetsp:Transcript_416/g.869  ORF Transcript_416/g.869 Transcript_416/m.869 type:complete len:100 (+) Transcript_416:205-504(+)